MILKLARLMTAYLAAVAATYTLASLAATQSVLARVSDLGLAVPLGERVGTSLHDVVGMASTYLPLVAIALLIAFTVAGLLVRRFPAARVALYAVAGGCGLWALHALLKIALDITPVAAARTVGGLAVQILCGAIGGYVFAWCRKVPATQ